MVGLIPGQGECERATNQCFSLSPFLSLKAMKKKMSLGEDLKKKKAHYLSIQGIREWIPTISHKKESWVLELEMASTQFSQFFPLGIIPHFSYEN